ncbi:hypothetical protein DFH08DRAFT_1090072 [Mycena albidolilacea]|uniref:Uncharacterized protein n=1 Tax=Mycena albidolilacea TaxID=1033008 RepID=A0AAD6YYX5_9AGAR|nr:hypothetical protein DFH08DRAFT_1090072 [Mycena albidolilacea]
MAQLSFFSIILLSAIAETFLYGIFMVSFFVALHLRLSKYTDRTARSEALRNTILIPTIVTFVTCSAHWIIGVIRLFKGFAGSEDTHSALHFLSDPAQPLVVARSLLVILNNLIGDAIIIQRLWFIWGRDLRVIVVPVLSWLGLSTSGFVLSYLFTHLRPENISYTGAWITVGWVLTTVINVYCTACIAWRIWRTNRVTQAIGGGLLMYVLVILVESAAIWAVWAIFFAVTNQTGSQLRILATDLAPPIIGLVNVLIYLRVGLGWSFVPSIDGTAGLTMTSVLVLPTMSEQDHLDTVTANPGTANKA